MRVAYLANYQGADLIQKRGVHANLALAGSRKIGEICGMLAAAGTEVVVFSLGAVAERTGKWHAAFQSHVSPTIPVIVRYASAWDVQIVSQGVGYFSLNRAFAEEHATRPFDAILLYNTPLPETRIAITSARRWGIPVVLEYEDSVEIFADGSRTWKNRVWASMLESIRPHVKGIIAASPELLEQLESPNKLLLRGLLSPDIRELAPTPVQQPVRILFAGSMQRSKGVDLLCEAWELLSTKGTELHLVGSGQELPGLQSRYQCAGRVFHGLVSRQKLLSLMSSAWIFANPHRSGRDLPGNVSPFKLVEYLGVGRPVISTRMGAIESELEQGICYSNSQSPADIAIAIDSVLHNYSFWAGRAAHAREAAWQSYSPATVASGVSKVLHAACGRASAFSTS